MTAIPIAVNRLSSPAPANAPAADQQRHGRDRQADLLCEHHSEQHACAVFDQESSYLVHRLLLGFGRQSILTAIWIPTHEAAWHDC
jgi:hypothetical protein